MNPIETLADDRLAEYRGMSDPELLRASGVFVAEGRYVVERILQDGRFHVRSLLLNEAARRALERPLSTLGSHVPIYVCPTDAFQSITGFNIHRGCLAVVERPPNASVSDMIDAARLVVVLDQVANPDNVGGIFRSAHAFGADAVLLTAGCSDPLYRKAIRTSMAATLRVPFAWIEDWSDTLERLRERRFVVAVLTPHEPAITPEAFAVPDSNRVAVCIGSEGAGLAAPIEAAADVRIRIPIRDQVDSLNASVAAGIALHAIVQKLARVLIPDP